jgi:hypothetical protein
MAPPNTFPTRRNRREEEERKIAVDQGPPRRVGRAGGSLRLNRKHVSFADIRENAAIEFGVGSELEICWA